MVGLEDGLPAGCGIVESIPAAEPVEKGERVVGGHKMIIAPTLRTSSPALLHFRDDHAKIEKGALLRLMVLWFG